MSKKITFRQLLESMSGRMDRSKSFTDSFVRELVEIIELGLKDQGEVSIAGFGKFELRWMDERKGVHPRTGEEIIIPGQSKVVFKPYKALREQVNIPFANLEPRILAKTDDETKHRQQLAVLSAGGRSTSEHKEDGDPDDLVREKQKPDEADRKESEEPFPFFVEYDESTGDDDHEELIKERPSPLEQAISQEAATDPALSEDETRDLAETVQEKGTYRWGWIAAIALVLILSLLLTWMMIQQMQDPESTDQPGVNSGLTEQIDEAQTGLPGDVAENEGEAEIPSAPADEVSEADELTDTAPAETRYTEVTVGSGQTLWSLAENHLGDPYLWPWIFVINSEQIQNPNLIVPNLGLRIPVLAETGELTASDRREVAEGYLELYDYYREQGDQNARHFLWAAGSFDPNLLDDITNRVDPDHLQFARTR